MPSEGIRHIDIIATNIPLIDHEHARHSESWYDRERGVFYWSVGLRCNDVPQLCHLIVINLLTHSNMCLTVCILYIRSHTVIYYLDFLC